MALTNQLDKTKIGLILKKRTVERERREGEKKKKKKRKRRRRGEEEKPRSKRYGTMTINMNMCFGLYGTTLDKDFFN